MKKLLSFLDRYGVIIILCLLLFVWIKSCSTSKAVKKSEKNLTEKVSQIEYKTDSLLKTSVSYTDLRIEGLRSEKRAIEACDRRKFDLERENQIDREIAELEKQK